MPPIKKNPNLDENSFILNLMLMASAEAPSGVAYSALIDVTTLALALALDAIRVGHKTAALLFLLAAIIKRNF